MTDRHKPSAVVPNEPADEYGEADFKPLTKEQAEALREKTPSISPWRVVAAQAVAGGVCAVLAWGLTGKGAVALSALYGAAAIVVPSAVLALGIKRSPATNPGAAVFGFLLWEMVKIAVAVVMLALASKVVPDLSWPALLVAMVVCVKVNWLSLLWKRKPVQAKTS